jgi:predicted nucleic acid-binding protein
MTDVETALAGVTRLGLDTAPIIYFVQAHPQYDTVVTEIFQQIDRGNVTGVTSVITLTEVLTQPLRHQAADLQRQYRDLLKNSVNLALVLIDPAIAEQAAALRARYNLRTPDALQVAAALSADCQAFVTNDRQLQRVTELSIIILDDLQAIRSAGQSS